MAGLSAPRRALEWIAERGDGVFDKRGSVLACGEIGPFTRQTWNTLRDLGLVEFYKPNENARGRRIRPTALGRQAIKVQV